MGKQDLSCFETCSLPALARCFPRSFTFYVADPSAPFTRCQLRYSASSFFQIVRGKHQPFDAAITHDSVDDLRDVGDRDVPVKKVIGLD